TKRSGKSRLLEVIAELTPRAEFTTRMSEASMYRLIASTDGPPTFLIDEIDAIFTGPPSERTEGLRALLNAGWRRGLTGPRCVGRGERIRVERSPTFCRKVVCGIGSTIPDTIADRSITIVMKRRKASEKIEKLRFRRYAAEARPIHEALATWAESAIE